MSSGVLGEGRRLCFGGYSKDGDCGKEAKRMQLCPESSGVQSHVITPLNSLCGHLCLHTKAGATGRERRWAKPQGRPEKLGGAGSRGYVSLGCRTIRTQTAVLWRGRVRVSFRSQLCHSLGEVSGSLSYSHGSNHGLCIVSIQ